MPGLLDLAQEPASVAARLTPRVPIEAAAVTEVFEEIHLPRRWPTALPVVALAPAAAAIAWPSSWTLVLVVLTVLVAAVAGETQHQKRLVTQRLRLALSADAGHVKVRCWRWRGWWCGRGWQRWQWHGWWRPSPRRIRVTYLPTAREWEKPLIESITTTVSIRTGQEFAVTRVSAETCEVWLSVNATPATDSDPEMTPGVALRLERATAIIGERLGRDAQLQEWDIDDQGELARLLIKYPPTEKVAQAQFRARITRSVTTLLPGRWRATWHLEHDSVVFEVRPPLPKVVPAPCVIADEWFSPAAVDEDGQIHGWNLRGSGGQPHAMVVGPTGSGKTVFIRSQVVQLAMRGVEVRICDPKRMEYRGLRDWPNITMLATQAGTMSAAIASTHQLMRERYEALENGHPPTFPLVALVLDEYRNMHRQINAFYAATKGPGRQPTKCPLWDMVDSLIELGRTAGIRVIMGTQRPDADWMGGDARDNFRFRCSTGPLSPDGARMMWESSTVGVALPTDPGRATMMLGAGFPGEVRVLWTPDPAVDDDPDSAAHLARLRPTHALHQRLVLHPPGPEAVWEEWLAAPWVPDTATPQAPVEDLPVHKDDLEPTTTARGEPELTETATQPEVLDGVDWEALESQFADDLDDPTLPSPDDAEDILEGHEEGDIRYGDPEPVVIEHLENGDLVLVSEADQVWAVVEALEEDPLDPTFISIDYCECISTDAGTISLPGGETVTCRRNLGYWGDLLEDE